eukprot:1760825-Prymnesium_polylepis.1
MGPADACACSCHGRRGCCHGLVRPPRRKHLYSLNDCFVTHDFPGGVACVETRKARLLPDLQGAASGL